MARINYCEKADYLRQSTIIDIKEFKDNAITIVGCGAIGSFLAVSLAKMGLEKFHLYDRDIVDAHNLPNQFFKEDDIGEYKVRMTRDAMQEFNSDVDVHAKRYHVTKGDKSFPCKNSPIVISCVDNMDTRKMLFNKCKKKKTVQLFIDTRMGGLQGQVYCIDMSKKKEIKNYEKSLFPQSEAVPIRCTERSIIFTVLGIASIVCGEIVKALNGGDVKNFIVLDYIVPQVF